MIVSGIGPTAELWTMFNSIVMDHVTRPRNCGPLDGHTHKGIAGVPGDGPFMILEFEVERDTVVRAAYTTYSCPAAIASGSIVAELAAGKRVSQILGWTAKDITVLLGGLPEGKSYLPELVVQAIVQALGRP